MGVTIETPGGSRTIDEREAVRIVEGLRQRAGGVYDPVANPKAAVAAAETIERAIESGQVAKIGEADALDALRQVLEEICRHNAEPEVHDLLTDLRS